MPENREEAIAPEIREALDELTRELKLTRIVFAAMRATIEEMIAQDACEILPGYTRVTRDMN